MKRLSHAVAFGALLLTAILFSAPFTSRALAQQVPDGGGPGSEMPAGMQQFMERVRDDARAQTIAALSATHRSRVATIVARVRAGKLRDALAAARQIDAIIDGNESQVLLTVRDHLVADMFDARTGPERRYGDGPGGDPGPGPGPGFGPRPEPGDPRRGLPPDAGRPPADPPAIRNDAGLALLMINLNHDQLRALFGTTHARATP